MEDNNKKKKKKKNSKLLKVLDILIPVVCIGIFVYAAVSLFFIYKSYGEARQIYDGLALYISDEDEDTAEEAANMEEAGFPYINVDFDSLSQINQDFLGWIYFPLLDISYPVVYGDEDFTYLHIAMDGTPSNSGCIFIDCGSNPDIKDMTTIFYGHNMRNGSMFGSLKRVRQEEGLIEEDPYFYYYTPTTAYKCHIFAYYLDKDGGRTYQAPENNLGYDEYMDYVLSMNEYEKGPETVDLAHRPQLMTLSTCSGRNSGKRTVLQAVIEDRYTINDSIIVGDYFETE